MTNLLKLTGEPISIMCGVSPPPKYNALVVKNRTLGGSFHIQVIGGHTKTKQIKLLVTKDNSNVLSEMYASASKVKLVEDDAYFICLMDDAPDWKYEAKDIYSSALTLLVIEEGPL